MKTLYEGNVRIYERERDRSFEKSVVISFIQVECAIGKSKIGKAPGTADSDRGNFEVWWRISE